MLISKLRVPTGMTVLKKLLSFLNPEVNQTYSYIAALGGGDMILVARASKSTGRVCRACIKTKLSGDVSLNTGIPGLLVGLTFLWSSTIDGKAGSLVKQQLWLVCEPAWVQKDRNLVCLSS